MSAGWRVAGARERHDDVDELELSIVMPCLNEAETLATCIVKAQRSLVELGVRGEVVIADNGSTAGPRASPVTSVPASPMSPPKATAPP